MAINQDKVVRLLTVVLPYAKIYAVQPQKNAQAGLVLAIDNESPLEQATVTALKNILEASGIDPVDVIDINSLSKDEKANVLHDAIPWKN